MRALLILAACLGCWRINAEEHCKKKAVDQGDDLDMDVVYTYVNGNDKTFLEEKRKHEEALDSNDKQNKATRSSDAINTRRFTDHDELRMSVRSVLKNMPWVRCIYIVVADGDKQIPEWFNANQNRVQIVRHKAIFKDHKALPTYNSHAIEANLYNMKDLARFFLYMNDDFYINAPVTKEDFVDMKSLKAKPSFNSHKIDTKESEKVRQMAYTAANINNKNLLESLKLINPELKGKEHYLAHVAYIQDKLAFTKIMKNPKVAEQQSATSKRRFRNKQDYWFPGLLTLYDYTPGHKSALRVCYIETKEEKELKKLIHKCITGHKAKRFKLLCINDVVDTDEKQLYTHIQTTLLNTWPHRSVAEKDDYRPDKKPENPDLEARADEVNEEDLMHEESKDSKESKGTKSEDDDDELKDKKPSHAVKKSEDGDEDEHKKPGHAVKKSEDADEEEHKKSSHGPKKRRWDHMVGVMHKLQRSLQTWKS